MNPMIQALQQSRDSNPVASAPGNDAPAPAAGNPGDMEKYWSMIQDMNAKLDKVLEALSAKYTGKEPDMPESGKETKNDSGSGY